MTATTVTVPTWNAEQSRGFIEKMAAEEFHLIDVRQPAEFEAGHIPGARLVPLGGIAEGVKDLRRDLPVLVYCKMGARGAAAAAILLESGFEQVRNVEGGIEAWNGAVVDGAPSAGLAWFMGVESTAELVSRAWLFEEGARIFYEKAQLEVDEESAATFAELAEAEDHHKDALDLLHRQLTGGSSIPKEIRELTPKEIEGGAQLSEALDWIRGRDPRSILEYAMALEATAYDRYAQLARISEEGAKREMFQILADGERHHLRKIVKLYEQRL